MRAIQLDRELTAVREIIKAVDAMAASTTEVVAFGIRAEGYERIHKFLSEKPIL